MKLKLNALCLTQFKLNSFKSVNKVRVHKTYCKICLCLQEIFIRVYC